MEVAESHNTITDEPTSSTCLFRCKKCRNIVACAQNVIAHNPGSGQEAFKWRKREANSPDNSTITECSSVFVEPLKWMDTVQGGQVEGKLSCSKCSARLGSFNWAGLQCSCGAWVNPAFQLHKRRVDATVF